MAIRKQIIGQATSEQNGVMSVVVCPFSDTGGGLESLYLFVENPVGTLHRGVDARLMLLLGSHLPVYTPSNPKDLADTRCALGIAGVELITST